MNIKLPKVFILPILLFVFNSCQTTISSVAELPEAKAYDVIKRSYAKKNWDDVSKDIGEFKIRYPYSKYSTELELMQANSFFEAKNYPTAAVTYEDFIRRNPYSPQLEYAHFRIAESYDLDSIKASDRSQANTEKALAKYKEFVHKFPNSKEYDQKANARIEVLTRRLADQSFFIATFYWEKGLYAAALMRYIYLLDNYSQFPDIAKVARKNGAYCYNKLAKMLEKNPKSEEFVFFKNETPQGLREKARNIGGG